MTTKTTATATADADTTAEALQMIDAVIASVEERQEHWRQENAAIVADMRERADEAILALIDNTAEPVAHVLRRGASFADTTGAQGDRTRVSRTATIRSEGLAEFQIAAEAIEPDRPGRCVSMTMPGEPGRSGANPGVLTDALAAARRVWLAEQRRRQEAEAIRQRRLNEDATAIGEWAPLYDAHCAQLAAAAQHNAAIMLPILENLAGALFSARRFQYGIIYGDGAEPTTETIWIVGSEQAGEVLEIEETGQVFPTTYYHPVSLGAVQGFTPRQVDAESAIDPRRCPPIRAGFFNDGVNKWRVIAPPSVETIEATIRRAVSEASATLKRAPEPPAVPWVHDAERLAAAVEEIEERHLRKDTRAALRRHLAEVEIPF